MREKAEAAPSRAAAERAEILSRLRERIVAFASSRMEGAAAEDLAQEVLLVLHRKYPEVTAVEELVPLAFQILRYKILELRRRQQRAESGEPWPEGRPAVDPRPNPEQDVIRQQMMERLREALQSLGGRCRELFRLKLEGKSYREIQAILGVRSINTIYTWDFRCRQALLERMGGRWEAEP